jgi:transposase, IS5 family
MLGTEKLTGSAIEGAYVDKGTDPHSIFISGQRRGIFGTSNASCVAAPPIEAVVGHMKMDGHLGRCYLKGREGDAMNAILSAIGCNFRLVLAWLRILLSLILLALSRAFAGVGVIGGDALAADWEQDFRKYKQN